MKCPACGNVGSTVYDTHYEATHIPGHVIKKRRRKCLDYKCDHKFVTYEIGLDLFAQLLIYKHKGEKEDEQSN